jgi:trans-2,3-dihydro-3-hydroxyanthranilate isomerase
VSNTQHSSSSAPRTLDYALVDVFAEHPLEGNQLAIFTDARGLTTGQMQSLARETNLSETTFILPRSAEIECDRGVQVRIFTVEEEFQFAGHPALGTASWLYWNHPTLRGADTVTLDLPIGPIPVRFATPTQAPATAEVGVFATMRQNDPVFGALHDRAAVATALGLTLEDLDPNLPIQSVTTGLPFCIVPLRSLDVAKRLAIPQHLARPYLAQVAAQTEPALAAKFFHCITPADPSSGAHWHARMQFYNGEDPATGSASGCTIAYLVQHGVVASGQSIVLEQGIEMLRPSRIQVQATLLHNKVENVFVGGRTIPVATGRFFLPGCA